jgi:hypothetical protein
VRCLKQEAYGGTMDVVDSEGMDVASKRSHDVAVTRDSGRGE